MSRPRGDRVAVDELVEMVAGTRAIDVVLEMLQLARHVEFRTKTRCARRCFEHAPRLAEIAERVLVREVRETEKKQTKSAQLFSHGIE